MADIRESCKYNLAFMRNLSINEENRGILIV